MDRTTSSPGTRSENSSAYRMGIFGAAATLAGIALSGPTAFALVQATHPQPPWQDAELFARSYHEVQLLPYVGGIVLVAGLVVLVSALHAFADAEQRARTAAALVFAASFASLIIVNYVVQTSFLPGLATHYLPENAPIIAALSMSNPRSLAWAIEMWGWGLCGAATWSASSVFRASALERATGAAFAVNGPLSILGALWTSAQPAWVATSVGIGAFAVWNGLLAVMAVLAIVVLRRRALDARLL